MLAFAMCLIVLVGQNYEALFRGQLFQIASSYIGLPVFLAIWGIHKLVTKEPKVELATADVSGVEVEAS